MKLCEARAPETPFKRFYQGKGCHKKKNTNRALKQAFTENVDYVTVRNIPYGDNENTGRSEDTSRRDEILLMLLFCGGAKPGSSIQGF